MNDDNPLAIVGLSTPQSGRYRRTHEFDEDGEIGYEWILDPDTNTYRDGREVRIIKGD